VPAAPGVGPAGGAAVGTRPDSLEHLLDGTYGDPPQHLNGDQRRVASAIFEYLLAIPPAGRDEVAAAAAGVDRGQQGNPLCLLVHGGPGCGKSWTVRYVLAAVARSAALQHVRIRCCAFSAAAARNLPHGATIHGLLGLSIHPGQDRKPIPATKLDQLRRDLAGLHALVVDEVSLIDARLLGRMAGRLQLLTGRPHLPFGGVAIISLGDFYQISPVQSASLVASVMAGDSSATPQGPAGVGRDLFATFRCFQLQTQERARGDAAWSAHLQAARATGRIPRGMLESLRELTEVDGRDPAWRHAVHVCANNRQRSAVNAYRMLLYAKEEGVPLVQWYTPLTSEKRFSRHSGTARQGTLLGDAGADDELTDAQRAALFVTDSRFTFSFAAGAPALLTTNGASLASRKGLVNGTDCRMHSLRFSDAEADADRVAAAKAAIAAAAPGTAALLPIAPTHLLVQIDRDADGYAPTAGETLLVASDGAWVVAIASRSNAEADDVHIVTSAGAVDAKVVRMQPAVEPRFSVTYHKIQGRTLPRVILSLQPSPAKPAYSFEAVLVALSRVTDSRNLRVLPMQASPGTPVEQTWKHILKLRVSDAVPAWLAGFDDHGVWSRARALAAQRRARAAAQAAAQVPPRRSRRPPPPAPSPRPVSAAGAAHGGRGATPGRATRGGAQEGRVAPGADIVARGGGGGGGGAGQQPLASRTRGRASEVPTQAALPSQRRRTAEPGATGVAADGSMEGLHLLATAAASQGRADAPIGAMPAPAPAAIPANSSGQARAHLHQVLLAARAAGVPHWVCCPGAATVLTLARTEERQSWIICPFLWEAAGNPPCATARMLRHVPPHPASGSTLSPWVAAIAAKRAEWTAAHVDMSLNPWTTESYHSAAVQEHWLFLTGDAPTGVASAAASWLGQGASQGAPWQTPGDQLADATARAGLHYIYTWVRQAAGLGPSAQADSPWLTAATTLHAAYMAAYPGAIVPVPSPSNHLFPWVAPALAAYFAPPHA
jgi:hypothetical protein